LEITSPREVVIKVGCCIVTAMTAVRLSIDKTWDGEALPSPEHAHVDVAASEDELLIWVDAPFAGDALPAARPGRTERLWEHECVEVFFAESASRQGRYLEVELGPHGHWLALGFAGYRELLIPDVRLSFEANISGDRWRGRARIGWLEVARVMPGIGAMNAYAIRGAGPARRFMAAWPAPAGVYAGPDFHRIEHFMGA